MNIMGLAILDEFWDVKSANDKFFEFIGGNNFQSVLKLIKEEQADSFVKMFKLLDEKSVSSGVFDMLNFDGNYYPVYIKVRYKDESKKYYELKLWDIIKSEEYFSQINADEKKLRNLLTIGNDICFEYLPETDNFRLFMFSGFNEMILYNDTLERWKNEALNNNYIDKESIAQFNKFCSEIRGFELQSEYYFRTSIFSNGTKMQNIRCYCRRNAEDIEINDSDSLKKIYILGIIRAFSSGSQQQNESILFSEMSRDFLTGVLNKMSIQKYCEDKISEKPPFKMSMAIIDVDNFKAINDNLGHMYGDKVLVKVAEIITGYVSEYGTVGRFGGDEFFVIFENVKNLLELRGILRSIRSSVETEFEGMLKDIKVTLSIGVSTYPDNGNTYEELFKLADKALYIAKEKGKNRYVIYNRELHGDFMIGQDSKVVLGRGVKDYTEFMIHIISKLLNRKKEAVDINHILREIKNKFLIDRVNIFYGDDFYLTYSSDKDFDKQINAKCFKNQSFIDKFDRSGEFVVNHIDILEVKFKDVHSFFDKENVFSVVHCLIGNSEAPRGIITFEKIGSFQKWAVEEIKNFAVIASVISGVL